MQERSFTDAALLEATKAVRGYAHKLTRNADQAEDLLQDTIVRALGKQDLFQPGTNLRLWLLSICHNIWVNYLRKEKRAVHIEITETNGGSCEPNAEVRLLAIETSKLLKKLAPTHLAVLSEVVKGNDYGDAAKKLGMPLGTLRSRLSRSREWLRNPVGLPPGESRPNRQVDEFKRRDAKFARSQSGKIAGYLRALPPGEYVPAKTLAIIANIKISETYNSSVALAITDLRARGYEIENKRLVGYRLKGEPLPPQGAFSL